MYTTDGRKLRLLIGGPKHGTYLDVTDNYTEPPTYYFPDYKSISIDDWSIDENSTGISTIPIRIHTYIRNFIHLPCGRKGYIYVYTGLPTIEVERLIYKHKLKDSF